MTNELARASSRAQGEYVPDIAIAGGFSTEDHVFKVLAMGAPYTKAVCMGRALMIPGFVGKNIESWLGHAGPAQVGRSRSAARKEEIFVTYETLKAKYGDEVDEHSRSGAIGVYTFADKLKVGLQQLMSGSRNMKLRPSAATTYGAHARGRRGLGHPVRDGRLSRRGDANHRGLDTRAIGTQTPARTLTGARRLCLFRRQSAREMSLLAELRSVEACEGASCCEQLPVGALLEHFASVHDDDAVGVSHGREPVGDDERGAPAQDAAQPLLDEHLGARVDRRGRLVEDEDRGVADDRARERDELPLTGRQRPAALADGRVEPFRAAPR